MKAIDELYLPDDRGYTKDHEWALREGDTIRIGIDDYAQDQLGDIVFVELPEVGAVFAKGDEFGTVESVKAVSELFMPVGGEVVKTNSDLADQPELVNQSPYEKGWMVEIKPDDSGEWNTLLDRTAYLNLLKKEQ